MSVAHSLPRGLAVVALGFDDRAAALLDTAVTMARRFGIAMRLVNVVEPPLYDALAVESPTSYTLPLVVQEEQARLVQERQQKMADVVRRLSPMVPVTGQVAQGDAVRMVVTEAVSQRANLIVTASHPDAHRFVPDGFSMALSLMHDAPLPVLVLGGAGPTPFDGPGFRILIADDLRDGTREAACKAYELAAQLPGATVRHLHVHGDFRETLRDTWVDLTARVPLLRTLTHTPDSLWSDEYEARVAALRTRGMPFRAAAERAGVRVENDVRTGDVGGEVSRTIETFDPHLVVFGRHKLLRTQPFLIGRMPFRAMLSARRAVLLVPPAADLYERLPFPGAAT